MLDSDLNAEECNEEPQAPKQLHDIGIFWWPFFAMALTRLRLLDWNSMVHLNGCGPQTGELRRIGMSSLAMIKIDFQLGGYCSWNHFPQKKAPQPQLPKASVWIVKCAAGRYLLQRNILRPFQLSRNVEIRSEFLTQPYIKIELFYPSWCGVHPWHKGPLRSHHFGGMLEQTHQR